MMVQAPFAPHRPRGQVFADVVFAPSTSGCKSPVNFLLFTGTPNFLRFSPAVVVLKSRQGAFDWLADEPDLYVSPDGHPKMR